MKDRSKRLTPNLRFPEFNDHPGWEHAKLGDVITTITPPKKLQTSDYRVHGSIPIVDQSPELVCGWTDDAEAVIEPPRPLILFGDHTCVLKLVRAAFAQGADGIKIFHSEPWIDTEYLFHNLRNRPLVMEDYKRHFSLLKERRVYYPDQSTDEQRKIAACLRSVDELLAAEGRKLDGLRAHKKGLTQQLFPREGESRPRLRFPEFRRGLEWNEKPLSRVAENLDNRRVPITETDRTKGDIPYYGASGIVDYIDDYIFDEDLLCISEDGANLVTRTYPIAFSISGKTWVNNHAHVLRFDDPARQMLVEVYLNATDLRDFITGMAQPKLNRGMLDTIPIPLPPTPAEQQRIADCLSSLDAVIGAQSRRLEGLRAHKKGLMQQLFPSPEEA